MIKRQSNPLSSCRWLLLLLLAVACLLPVSSYAQDWDISPIFDGTGGCALWASHNSIEYREFLLQDEERSGPFDPAWMGTNLGFIEFPLPDLIPYVADSPELAGNERLLVVDISFNDQHPDFVPFSTVSIDGVQTTKVPVSTGSIWHIVREPRSLVLSNKIASGEPIKVIALGPGQRERSLTVEGIDRSELLLGIAMFEACLTELRSNPEPHRRTFLQRSIAQ